MQDTISIHKVVRCEYASETAVEGICEKSLLACGSTDGSSLQEHIGCLRLAGPDPVAHKMGLEMVLLDRRCCVGKRDNHGHNRIKV